MNVLTYRAAYSIFPKESFEKRRTISFEGREITAEEAIEKYIKRGWKFLSGDILMYSDTYFDRSSDFHLGKRWIGGPMTWVLPFDVTGVEDRIGTAKTDLPTPLSCDPFTFNSFSVTSSTHSGIKMDFDIVKTPFFHHSYTASPEFSFKLSTLFDYLLQEVMLPSDTVLKR